MRTLIKCLKVHMMLQAEKHNVFQWAHLSKNAVEIAFFFREKDFAFHETNGTDVADQQNVVCTARTLLPVGAFLPLFSLKFIDTAQYTVSKERKRRLIALLGKWW